MTADAPGELDAGLDAAGVRYSSEVYPGATHGFTMADTGAFDPDALQRHWDRLLAPPDRALSSA